VGLAFRDYDECVEYIRQSNSIKAPPGGVALPLPYTVYERPTYSVVPSNAIRRDQARADIAAILRKSEQGNRRRDLYFPQVLRDARRTPWRVAEVEALPDFRLWVHFNDDTEGIVEMAEFINSGAAGVFLALGDEKLFREARVSLGAVTWPCEPDLAWARCTGRSKNMGSGSSDQIGKRASWPRKFCRGAPAAISAWCPFVRRQDDLAADRTVADLL
jgi:hypothetical protein